VSAFEKKVKSSGTPLKFNSEVNLQALFEALQCWHNPNPPKNWRGQPVPIPDVVSLGDAWLKDAIVQKLIQPWQVEGLTGWQGLDPRYRAVVQRNEQGFSDAQGQIWGLPYRWGSTALAYRVSDCRRWGWEPQDWGDLWRTELRGKIGLPDSAREVIGLTLKALGQSYNAPDPNTVAELPHRLAALQSQVKFYSSTHLVQPLLTKDVSLIVGWSTDLLPLLALDKDIRVVLPQSGTALWADLWVRPAQGSGPDDLLLEWVNFCWEPKMAPLFSQFGHGTSP
jgi:putative spermidine/putrescine transport system substrate-binding protein